MSEPVTNETVLALTNVVTTMTKTINQLATKVRRGRTALVLLAVSVAFDLILSFGFFYALHGTNDAQHQTQALVEQVAKNNTASQQRCQLFNESNTRELQLWQGLLALPKAPGTPPTDPATLEAFNKLLSQTFYQLDCSAIGK